MPNKHIDERFMAVAIRLAQRHIGLTAENPSVGAIIVKNDIIVGRGVTAKSGRPHAEVIALAEAGEAAKGATAYVTLEPCSHYGKTPPCADALIKAGIIRVVIAIKDPDNRVAGRGIEILKQAGICVVCGILASEAFKTLSAYLIGKQLNRPEVTLKMAISADKAIGRKGQGIVKISNEISHFRSHIMRAENQAILVGIGTVLDDDPDLTCRLTGLEDRSPIRIILDSQLQIPLDSKLVLSVKKAPLWVISTSITDIAKRDILLKAGVIIIEMPLQNNYFSISELLNLLFVRGIKSILVEGGAKTALLFLKSGYVDRLILFQSQIVMGKHNIPAPNFLDFLNDFRLLQSCYYCHDYYQEWRRKTSCLLV